MLTTAQSQEKLDPRVKRTRALIQQAFHELLAEKGFQSITVQDLTERAEVNRATFYAHYADKYALLDESIRTSFRQEMEKRTLSACHFNQANLRALIVTVCDFITQANKNCNPSEAQFESLVESQVRKQIQELLEFWLEKTGSEIDLTSPLRLPVGRSMGWHFSGAKKRTVPPPRNMPGRSCR